MLDRAAHYDCCDARPGELWDELPQGEAMASPAEQDSGCRRSWAPMKEEGALIKLHG